MTLRSRQSSEYYDYATFRSGERALRSPKMARTIRTQRANRGRTAIPSNSKEATVSTKRKQSSTREKRQATAVAKKVTGMDLPYESALEALRTYHSLNGDLVIPRRYVVPKDDENFPKEWHGVNLAGTVYNMRWWQRHVRQNRDRVTQLNQLGFIWERLQPEWNLVLEALVTYSSLYGDLLVPVSFVIPHGSRNFPKATWGIPLGSCVFRIRARNDFLRGKNASARRAQLDALGFVWDLNECLFQKLLMALKYFVKLEQDNSDNSVAGKRPLRVPSTFKVPSGEQSGWPCELWGYPLGEKCIAVRQKQLYIKNEPERQRALAEVGFHWGGNASLGWLEVVHAAAIYSQMNDRNLDVPYNFVVPAPPHVSRGENVTRITGSDDAWPWPEYLWGLRLGQRLKDIRVKGAYLSGDSGRARRAQLDALGFDWSPKRGRRKRPVV